MMTTTHPLAKVWLDRIDHLATGMPAERHHELLADLRDHLDQALGADPSPTEVEAVLTRMGDPADIVAAAAEDLPRVPPPAAVGWPATIAPPPAPIEGEPPATSSSVPNAWEVSALTSMVLAGILLLPGMLVGQTLIIVGLLYAAPIWMVAMVILVTKTRWTASERVAALAIPLTFAISIGLLLAFPISHEGGPVDAGSCELVEVDGSLVDDCTDQDGNPIDPDGYPLDANGNRIEQPTDWRWPLSLVWPPLVSIVIAVVLVRRLRRRVLVT